MELIIEQMSKISLSEDPLPLLINMKTSLVALSSREVATSFQSNYPLSHIHPLFDVLNSSNSEQVNTCVDVLDHILNKVEPKFAFEALQEQYLRGLLHPNEKVRLLVHKQILSCSKDSGAAELVLNHRHLLSILLNSLGANSMEVVKYASSSLVNLCSQDNGGTRRIFTNEGFESLKQVMDVSDSCRFHVYDVVVKISLLNEESLVLMSSYGLLNQLVKEISSGDVLTQLNALELISKLAVNPLGLKLLQSSGIVTKLAYLLSSAKTDSMAAVILPGLLKFFGHLGAAYPHLLAEEAVVMVEIMKVASDFSNQTDITLQLIAFETLAHIGSSVEGKCALKKFKIEMENTLRDFSSHMTSFPSEMRVRVLDSLSKLFYLPYEHQTEDILSQLEIWFEQLSDGSSMKFLFDVARQPFPDLLYTVLQVMKSISYLSWGIKKMAEEPGLIEWLLNRHSCIDKDSKESRWEILGILSQSVFAREFFTEETQQKFVTFYTQGPFYLDAEPTVASERDQ